MNIVPYLDETDLALYESLAHREFLTSVDPRSLSQSAAVKHYEVFYPTKDWLFLHEAAVTFFEGRLFAAWYNCPETELEGRSAIRFSESADGGKTWTEPKTVADDASGSILYCPPVFGEEDGKLYLFLNEMVAADRMHALDLYVYDEASDAFSLFWSRPLPFKLNTNAVTLANGKKMLPGRIAELDGFPNTPAVLIADGSITGDWRLVKIAQNGDLPDGTHLIHPELTAIAAGERVYMFSRDDMRRVPLVYISEDNGETWSKPLSHDIPFTSSKIYGGTLADGRHYLTGNILYDCGRTKLALFLTGKDGMTFDTAFLLQDGVSAQFGYGDAWHYPAACEHDGKLFILYTANVDGQNHRGAVLSVVDLAAV